MLELTVDLGDRWLKSHHLRSQCTLEPAQTNMEGDLVVEGGPQDTFRAGKE